MRISLLLALVLGIAAAAAQAQAPGVAPAGCPDPSRCPVYLRADEMQWGKILPELGPDGPEIAILRVDAKTQATQLMIRAPKAMAVPWHWHTANETHTVLSGTFTAECEGKRAELGPGSFNYFPARSIHRAWLTAGCQLFITVDAAWDLTWVLGPPTAPKPGEPAPSAEPPPVAPVVVDSTARTVDGLPIEALELGDAPGRADAPRAKKLTDPAALTRVLAALKPSEVKPSGGKNRWIVNLWSGKGGLVAQAWVFESGEWGYGGRSRGASPELAKVIEEMLAGK